MTDSNGQTDSCWWENQPRHPAKRTVDYPSIRQVSVR